MQTPYVERYPVGTYVRVAPRHALEQFRAEWQHHHPLTMGQLDAADLESRVSRVSFYHGGDVLYELHGIPGIWHEACLIGPPPTGTA